ncbi:reprolysin-like metallopeptidase [Streptomyces sp. NPDC050085]|uniref:InlB B-repeat-containing protein n=1 Tax=Streptomyces sp. NPDC050085 TaxID=3365600 RepID=UPI0037880993
MARYRWTAAVLAASVVFGMTGGVSGAADDGSGGRGLRPPGGAVVVTPPSPADAPADREEIGDDAVRSRTARVGASAVDVMCGRGPGDEVIFPLFDDTRVHVTEESHAIEDGRLMWSGTVAGAEDADVVATLESGCDGSPGDAVLSAQFMLGGDAYVVESAGPGQVTISELTPMAEEDETPLAAPPASAPARPAPAPAPPLAGPDCKGAKGINVVDVLIGYTPTARKEAGGDRQIRTQAARAVALANDAFADSRAKVRLRLVHTAATGPLPARLDTVGEPLLRAVADPGDKVADQLLAQRDQFGADLVSVLAGGKTYGGLGYVPPSPGPRTTNYGFSVVAQSAVGHYSFGHEIGHNLGASHDRVTQPVQPPPYGANGYFPRDGDWSTIMAYESGCRRATHGPCNRINQFENPNRRYRGEALGVPLGKRNEADTVDVFARTAKAVAAYRPARTAPSLCTVKGAASPKGAGSITAARPGPYQPGSSAAFTANARKGYVFDHWVLDGKKLRGKAATTRVGMARDRTLTAVFRKGKAPTSKVTAKTHGKGKVVRASGRRGIEADGSVLEGSDLLYEAEAAPGWRFAGWQLDGSYAGEDDTVALDVGADDMELTARFEPRSRTVGLLTVGGNGTLTASEPGPYAEGDTVHVSAVPEPGHVFVDWLLDGRPYGGDEEKAQGETSLLLDDHDHTLTAVFRCGCERGDGSR